MFSLQTERLHLREMTDDDLDDMAGMLGDPVVMEYYPAPKTRMEAQLWIDWNKKNYAEHGFGLWIVETSDGTFVGDCGLTWQDVEGRRELEVGFHVRADLQGRGYASEAAVACKDHAYGLGVSHLVAIIHPSNVASQRVAEKIGLTFELVATDGGRERHVYGANL
ncbi:GNAT family N-acetyltransferase [Pseudarthrobacter sp. S9]|uniref:GNAT family N-acetyltransferase n=1 Tax=Pseudarthrobacter sp. S9 TaxID=3418421 RepID=UPI003D081EAC